MSRRNRRDFLKRSAAGFAATFAIAGTKASGRVLGANDRVRIAVAGLNGRGGAHVQLYNRIRDTEVVYYVDPDSRLFAARTKLAEDLRVSPPKCIQEFRKAIDDKSIDAVSIATPNHSHALLAIWACQAGKDVYVEKPCSHNIFEGRKLVEAARKYDRIVQHGTQRRSDPGWIEQIAAIQSGKYGRLLISYAYASKPRSSIGFKELKAPPKELDFDIWLGPASEQPYHDNLVHYNWHWFWDFGNGEIGNQGIHHLDVARWAMPVGCVPKSVISLGGCFGDKDQGQTPNTLFTIIDFGDTKLFFENRGLVTDRTQKVANEFHMDQGVIKGGRFFPKGKTKAERIPGVVRTADDGAQAHFANFIDCVRSRKRENLNAEILTGHESSLLTHLGNISYRLGVEVPFNQETRILGDDKMAIDSFESIKEHLADATHLNLKESTYRLGRSLQYDAKAQQFVGDEEASNLLTRSYRKPYVVPETV